MEKDNLRIQLRERLGLPYNAGDAVIYRAVCKVMKDRENTEAAINVIVNHLEDTGFINQY